MISVLLVAVGLFYTNQANRKQQEATGRQQDLAAQAQVAERFSAAIDQLGQEGRDKLSIRLGSIYSLQRLMRDSPPDEPAVIEVLCAFIRTHAHALGPRPPIVPASSADIQAAVTVLAFRPHPEQHRRLDWAATRLGLPHSELIGARLAGADLHDAALYHVDLAGADLTGANLGGANLHHANLNGAHLHGARLHHANLQGTLLRGTDLTGTNLSDASLNGVNLSGLNLSGANLSGAHLNGANLGGANLTGVIWDGADLSGAHLSGAHLGGADLRGANVTGVGPRNARPDRTAQLPPPNR